MNNNSWENSKQRAAFNADAYSADEPLKRVEEENKLHKHVHHHIDLFPFLTTGEKRAIFFVLLAIGAVALLFSLVSGVVALSYLS